MPTDIPPNPFTGLPPEWTSEVVSVGSGCRPSHHHFAAFYDPTGRPPLLYCSKCGEVRSLEIPKEGDL